MIFFINGVIWDVGVGTGVNLVLVDTGLCKFESIKLKEELK